MIIAAPAIATTSWSRRQVGLDHCVGEQSTRRPVGMWTLLPLNRHL
jgi:hypothetical protein